MSNDDLKKSMNLYCKTINWLDNVTEAFKNFLEFKEFCCEDVYSEVIGVTALHVDNLYKLCCITNIACYDEDNEVFGRMYKAYYNGVLLWDYVKEEDK